MSDGESTNTTFAGVPYLGCEAGLALFHTAIARW